MADDDLSPAVLAEHTMVAVSLDDDSDEEEATMANASALPTYESTCCHGAPFPTEPGVAERARLAVAFAAKALWAAPSAYDIARAFDDAPGVVHPQCQALQQSAAIDAAAAGDAEAAAVAYNASRLIGAAVEAAGGPTLLRRCFEARGFRESLLVPGTATCADAARALRANAVGVTCACLGGRDLPYARRSREWEVRKKLGAERWRAGDYPGARAAYERARELLGAQLSRGFCDGGGRHAPQVRWLWDEEAVLLANASLCALKAGDAGGALENARCAVQRRPAYAKAHARKAAALEALGETGEAVESWRTARTAATAAGDAAAAKAYGAAVLRARKLADAESRRPARLPTDAPPVDEANRPKWAPDAGAPAPRAYAKGNDPNPKQPAGVPKFEWEYPGPKPGTKPPKTDAGFY